MSLLIRSAKEQDLDLIVSYQLEMARLTEGRELDKRLVTRGVQAVFEDRERGFYLIAELNGKVQASLLVTREWSDWRAGWFWWIQSVYVAEPARRRGLYRALHDEVRARAQQAGEVVGLRLYVEADNARAMEVYRRMGMEETPYRLFEEEL